MKTQLLALPVAVLLLSGCTSPDPAPSAPAAAPAVASAPASTPAPVTTRPATPSPTPTPTETTPPPSTTPPPPPSTAAAATLATDARVKAAAILQATDAAWLAEFEKGLPLTGGERVDWWTGGGALPVRVAKANIQAFNDADKLFTVDTEPASMTEWRDTFSDIPTDIQQWYNSDTGAGYDKVIQTQVEADFAEADRLAAKVAAGQ